MHGMFFAARPNANADVSLLEGLSPTQLLIAGAILAAIGVPLVVFGDRSESAIQRWTLIIVGLPLVLIGMYCVVIGLVGHPWR